MVEKRIYSLNLVTYLKSQGFKEKYIRKDEETNKAYYVFDESEEIARAIRRYKNDRQLHDFIKQYKKVKKEIHEV